MLHLAFTTSCIQRSKLTILQRLTHHNQYCTIYPSCTIRRSKATSAATSIGCLHIAQHRYQSTRNFHTNYLLHQQRPPFSPSTTHTAPTEPASTNSHPNPSNPRKDATATAPFNGLSTSCTPSTPSWVFTPSPPMAAQTASPNIAKSKPPSARSQLSASDLLHAYSNASFEDIMQHTSETELVEKVNNETTQVMVDPLDQIEFDDTWSCLMISPLPPTFQIRPLLEDTRPLEVIRYADGAFVRFGSYKKTRYVIKQRATIFKRLRRAVSLQPMSSHDMEELIATNPTFKPIHARVTRDERAQYDFGPMINAKFHALVKTIPRPIRSSPPAKLDAKEHRQRLDAFLNELNLTDLQELSIFQLEQLFTSIFILEKYPLAIHRSHLTSVTDVPQLLEQWRKEFYPQHRTITHLADIDPIFAVSWGSSSSSWTITCEGSLAAFLFKQIEAIETQLNGFKTGAIPVTRDEMLNVVSYTWRLLHSLRGSNLHSLLERTTDTRNDLGGAVLHAMSINAREKRANLPDTHMSHYFQVGPFYPPLVPVTAPDMRTNGLTSFTYQPIILTELLQCVENHIDLFIFPPSTEEVNQRQQRKATAASNNSSTDSNNDTNGIGADATTATPIATTAVTTSPTPHLQPPLPPLITDDSSVANGSVDEEGDEEEVAQYQSSSTEFIDIPSQPLIQPFPDIPDIRVNPHFLSQAHNKSQSAPLIPLDSYQSSHCHPDVPYPSPTSPMTNIIRLYSFIHSIRHLVAQKRWLQLFLGIIHYDEPTLKRMRQYRSTRAGWIVSVGRVLLESNQPDPNLRKSRADEMQSDIRNYWSSTQRQADTKMYQLNITEEDHVLPVNYRTAIARNDTLLYHASFSDVVYILQLLMVHQSLALGMSLFSSVVRPYLHEHLNDILAHATYWELESLIESIGKLGYCGNYSEMYVLHRLLQLGQLPTYQEIVHIENTTTNGDERPEWRRKLLRMLQRTQSPRITPDLSHSFQYPKTIGSLHFMTDRNQVRSIFHSAFKTWNDAPRPPVTWGLRLAKTFNQWTETQHPLRPKPNWDASVDASRRTGDAATRPQPLDDIDLKRWWLFLWTGDETMMEEWRLAPRRLARILCQYYSILIQDAAALEYHIETNGYHRDDNKDRHGIFLFEVTEFLFSLIKVEMEQYEWCIKFVREFIDWFELHYEQVDYTGRPRSEDAQILKTDLIRRRTSKISLDIKQSMKVSHKLMQVSLSLLLRTRAIDTPLPHGAPTFPPIRNAPFCGDKFLNFSSSWRDYFRLQRDSNQHGTVVSSFQVLVYRLLTDPQGPFAFRQRVFHQHFRRPSDQVMKELLLSPNATVEGQDALAHSELVLADHSMKSTSQLSGSSTTTKNDLNLRIRDEVPVDFFVEHTTSLGYILDAAIFQTPDSRPKSHLRTNSLTSLPAIQAVLNSQSNESSSPSSDAASSHSSNLTSSPFPPSGPVPRLVAESDRRFSAVAIEVDGAFHYRRGNPTVVNSTTRLRKKHLALCGWWVISIPFSDWNVRTEKQKREWLEQKFPRRLLKKVRKYELNRMDRVQSRKDMEAQRLLLSQLQPPKFTSIKRPEKQPFFRSSSTPPTRPPTTRDEHGRIVRLPTLLSSPTSPSTSITTMRDDPTTATTPLPLTLQLSREKGVDSRASMNSSNGLSFASFIYKAK